jgi:hypothetical protein
LNILAATALSSVRFSLRNLFTFFIEVKTKEFMILIRKRDLFWSEKGLENKLENEMHER